MNFRFWRKSWLKSSEEEWKHRQAVKLLNAPARDLGSAEAWVSDAAVQQAQANREARYRLGDSDGTRITEPTDGEAMEPGRDQGE